MMPLALTSAAALAVSLSFPTKPALHAAHLSALQTDGWVCVEDFCSPSTVRALAEEYNSLRAASRFSVAGVGEAGSTNRVDQSVRVCEQCFVYPKGRQPGHPLNTLYDTVDGLQDALGGAGKPLDSLLTEGLFVHYPDGGYYRRHIDAATGTTSALRAWSFLLYLNENWSEGDGGELRIFRDGGGEEAPSGAASLYTDVQPKAGTLVVFDSATVPHEVLSTSKARLAVVGWFSSQLEGSAGRRSLISLLSGALVAGVGVKFGLSSLGSKSSD